MGWELPPTFNGGGCTGGCHYYYVDSINLIYYSKGAETWGTPYYYFPTSVQQISEEDDKFTLYPTLNDGTFQININGAGLLPVNLLFYDITGRKIAEYPLNNQGAHIDIGPHSTGVYIWKATSKNQLLQTGKMVMH